jgi:hypothetical protein
MIKSTKPAAKNLAVMTLVVLGLILLAGASPVGAQIPRTVSHQGLLLLPGSGPAPDGNYTMTFRIYSQESGGSALWTEAQTLAVSGGVYNATLGSVTALNLSFDVQYWLGVQLSGESEMTPRVRLTSAPYAYRAVVAEGLAGGTAGDITAVYANDGLTGGATSGDAPLSVGAGTGIQVSADAVALAPSYADGSAYDARFVNEGQANSVTADMVTPNIVGALDGVANDGGNIDLIAGPNITITPDDANNQITISASGGGGGIGGSGATNYIPKFTGATTIGNSLVYDTGARIGIGTASPTARLTVAAGGGDDARVELKGTSQPCLAVDRTNPAGEGDIFFSTGGYANWLLRDKADGAFAISRGAYGQPIDVLEMSAVTTKVKATAPDYASYAAFSSEYTGGGQTDIIAVKGTSAPADYYGIGGQFRGGYVGVHGIVEPNGNFSYYGAQGQVNGGGGTNYGLLGTASGAGTNYGLYAQAYSGTTNYAGYFNGNVQVSGNLTVGGTKSFRIDHPLDPANRYLNHFAIESDEVMNSYSGNVVLDAAGEVWVELAEWFATINRDPRYQLTCIGGQAPVYIAQEITGNRFKIAGGTPGLKVSWQVTALRHDPTLERLRLPVEQEKPGPERGKYVDPESYGMPASMQIGRVEGKKPAGR